jgi:aminoglycoside 3'-phosphotransferase II
MSSVQHVRAVLEAARLPQPDALVDLVDHGRSGDLVAKAGEAVVKFASTPANIELLAREIAVLEWLGPQVPTAPVLWTGELEGGLALVMENLPDRPVSHLSLQEAADGLAATAQALAALHGLDPAGCPFDMRLDIKFALAERHVAAGLVDEDDFDGERVGWNARQALDAAYATRPATERLVLTHGDASLPNFLWSPGRPVRLIDLGRFGLADPYQDLALFLRSAKYNHPDLDAAAILREHYPLAQIDEAACDFYRLMDELF